MARGLRAQSAVYAAPPLRAKNISYCLVPPHQSSPLTRVPTTCTPTHVQTGPFPFATGSLQGLSHSLAADLVSAPRAASHVRYVQQKVNGSSRKTPVYEDAWLGYALVGLLEPSVPPRRIHVVFLGPPHFFDDNGFRMTNMTSIVHWRSGKSIAQNRTLLARMRAAFEHAQAFHCSASVPLVCNKVSHIDVWMRNYPQNSEESSRNFTQASSLALRRDRGGVSCRGGCTPGMVSACYIEPDKSACKAMQGGLSTYNFGPTAELIERYVPSGKSGVDRRVHAHAA